MKKITFLFLLFLTPLAFCQVVISENFDSGTPAGWTDSYSNSSTQSCAGSSERDNLFSTDDTGDLTSPNFAGASNGTDLDVSFDYKVVDWSAATNPTAPGWGTAELQYSTDDGANWTTALLINDANHVTSASCATMMTTISAASLPNGSDVKLRIFNTWANGDYYFYVDNFQATQVVTSAPDCPINVMDAEDSNCGNYDVPITWDASSGALGYRITVGTTSNGTDIENDTDLGNVTSYILTGTNVSTDYFYTVVAYNGIGDSTGCSEMSFTTGGDVCHCDPSSTNSDTTTLISDFVTTNGNSNISNTGSGLSSGHYESFYDTFAVTSFENGEFDFSVTIEGGTVGCAIWIDWNSDLIYDPMTETVYNTTSYGNGPFTGTITVPSSTPNGDYYMRVMIDWNDSNPDDDACTLAAGRGEVEDYKVTIVDAPSCAPPTSLMATTTGTDTVDITWSAGSSETMWTYEFGVSPYTQGGGGTSGAVMTNPSLSLSGLTGSTSYDIYIQANCGGSDSSFALLNWTQPPTNDLCTDAILLTPGGTFSDNAITGQTNTQASGSGELPLPGCASYDPADASGNGGDLWYAVTVPADGNLTIETDSDPTGSGGDGGMAIYTGSCGSLTLFECNDDGGNGTFSQVIIEPVDGLANQTVYVRVWEFGGNAIINFQVSAFSATLSNDEFSSSQFSYYPNPTKDKLHFNSVETIDNISVYNLLGQEVLRQNSRTINPEIDMSTLGSGNYFVKVTIQNRTETIKIIKE